MHLLYEATHTHPASMCPLLTSEGKVAIEQLFSDVNIKRASIRLDSAYLSCPEDTAADHKAFFTIEADGQEAIISISGTLL